MTVPIHLWAFEINDDCDMMVCGLILYFDDNCDIIGPHDFALNKDIVTCPTCLSILNAPKARSRVAEKIS